MFCTKCAGSGEYRGNGMITVTCTSCFGHGLLDDKDEEETEKLAMETGVIDKKIDRRSKAYRDAIKKIMDINPSITYQDSVKMFEKEFERA